MRWSIVLTPVTRWPRTSLAILVSINTPYNVYLSYRTSDSHVIPRSYKTFWPIYKKDILSSEFPSTRKINLNNINSWNQSLKKIKENKDLALNRFLSEFKAHKALMIPHKLLISIISSICSLDVLDPIAGRKIPSRRSNMDTRAKVYEMYTPGEK